MDAFDGDSDLSSVSAPPTPGAAATPRGISPESWAPATNDTSPPPTTSAASSSTRRASRRVAQAAVDTLPGTSTPATESPASKSSRAKASDAAPSGQTPTSARRASTRDRKPSAKVESRSPSAEQPSSTSKSKGATAAETTKTKIKSLKLSVKSRPKQDASGTREDDSLNETTPEPSSSKTKVTLKVGGRNKRIADEVRDLADDDDEELDAVQSGDDFVPEADTAIKEVSGKRGRTTRKARTVVADDEEDEEVAVKAPKRKRAKLEDETRVDAGKGGKGRGGKSRARMPDFSSGEGEEMVDAASDEDDLADAATTETDDDFDDEQPTRGGAAKKRKSTGAEGAKKNASRTAASSKPSLGATKKAPVTSAATSSSATGGNKTISAEARMRASIDAALDKSKPPTSTLTTKLNPQASAFRPSSASKPSLSGTSTPTGAGKASASTAAAGVRRAGATGSGTAFGKSMSGWDSLFGSISGLSSSASSSTPTKTPTKATKPTSATGIRPDPLLEAASAHDLQRFKSQAVQEHLDTDECFDLLAHADIMLAFERGIYVEDRKLASRLRPIVWRAGSVLAKPA